MKTLECEICGEEYEVDNKIEKVICTECLITEEVPVREGKTYGYSNEALLKLISVGIDDWEIPKDEIAEGKKLINKFNNLREKNKDLVNIKRNLDISWRKTKRLEGFRLLKKGWYKKDIARELKVTPKTVSQWNLTLKHKSDVIYHDEKKRLIFDFESLSYKASSETDFGGSDQKIRYNFSPESLEIIRREKDRNSNAVK